MSLIFTILSALFEVILRILWLQHNRHGSINYATVPLSKSCEIVLAVFCLLTYQRGHASSVTSLPELSFAYVVVGFSNYFNKRVITGVHVFYC